MRKYGKTLQIQVSMNDLIIYEWISPILFPVRSVSMLEIHGDTELSNMESFNLKETKNGDNRNWIKEIGKECCRHCFNCKCSYTYRCMCWKNKAHSE